MKYDSPLLIGTADRLPRTGWAVVVLSGSILGGVGALVALVTGRVALAWWLTALFALGIGLTVWLESRSRRRRTFVLNFADQLLRFDSTTRLGSPLTHFVSFDEVKDLHRMVQGDGRLVLTIDAEVEGVLRREVLAANVGPSELDALERVERTLRAALGLLPVAVEADAANDDEPIDSFG